MASINHHALVELLQIVHNADYSFTTITPLSHERVNSRPGNSRVKPSNQAQILREIFGWSRAFHESDIDDNIFATMRKAGVLTPCKNSNENSDEKSWLSNIRISTFDDEKFGKQFFIHSAYPTTEADAVFFGPDTYRYLHEINALINQGTQVHRAVDIGTGAGPGAILMALHYPQAEVYAVDINQLALDITVVNAAVAKTQNVIALYSDLLTGLTGNFDLIVANPPYLVDEEQRSYRHGGGDFGAGLSYAIVEAAISRLNPSGTLLLYTGVSINDGADVFKNGIEKYLQSLPQAQHLTWSYREIDPDIFGEELSNACYAETDRIAAIALKITLSS